MAPVPAPPPRKPSFEGHTAGAAAGSLWPKLGVSVRSTKASGPSLAGGRGLG